MTGRVPPRAITRRTLLLAGAGAAATAAIPKVAMAAAEAVAPATHLDRSTWEPLVGTIIETRNRGYPRVPLQLMSISDTDTTYGQTDKIQERSFVLVFRGPVGQPLMDTTHTLFVPGVGKVDIWFSSARLTDEGWDYVAVFSNSRIRQRPPTTPKASRGQRVQAREVSRKSAKRARRARRRRREREREEERVQRAERRRRRRLEKLAGS
jgi:hypothetical protein